MKKKLLAGLATGLFVFGMVEVASANIVTANGNLSTSSEVDYWNINLSSTSDLTIDMLAFEAQMFPNYDATPLGIDFFNNGIDNDGLDTHIYLLDSSGNNVASNDDPLTSAAIIDGSRSTYWGPYGIDSYLSVSALAAGQYTLAVGSYDLSLSDALDGFNEAGNTSGLYQVSFSSNIDGLTVNSVPEPASMLLFGTGLAGLVGIRRKKK